MTGGRNGGRPPSSEMVPVEPCEFGSRDRCMLDETLDNVQGLHVGYRRVAGIVKRNYMSIREIRQSQQRIETKQAEMDAKLDNILRRLPEAQDVT